MNFFVWLIWETLSRSPHSYFSERAEADLVEFEENHDVMLWSVLPTLLAKTSMIQDFVSRFVSHSVRSGQFAFWIAISGTSLYSRWCWRERYCWISYSLSLFYSRIENFSFDRLISRLNVGCVSRKCPEKTPVWESRMHEQGLYVSLRLLSSRIQNCL